MNKNIKSPLEILVMWDELFEDGQKYGNLIYSSFNRKIENPMENSIGIQVSFCHSEDFQFLYNAENTIVFILIDDEMIINKTKWANIVDGMLAENKNKLNIFPIAFSTNSISIFPNLSGINFIIADDSTKYNKFILSISYSIYKTIFNYRLNEKIEIPLFLSHTKRDGIGEQKAKGIKDYLYSQGSAVKVFFDENNIDFGERFEEKIEDGIKTSTVVILHTDGYSGSEWCRKELLYAKRHKRPIVVIDFLSKGENRSFPYMGNTKVIRIESNINYFVLINQILIESIKIKYFELYTEYLLAIFAVNSSKIEIIPYPPELLTNIYSKYKTIVYPSPPLGIEELDVLNQQQNKKYITPTLLSIKSNNYENMLNGITVGYSVSESDLMLHKNDVLFKSQEMILGITRYLLSCGARISYNGNFEYGKYNFLSILIELVRTYREYETKTNTEKHLTYHYFQSDKIKLKSVLSDLTKYTHLHEHQYESFNDVGKTVESALNFTNLRVIINDLIGSRIFIGGKQDSYIGLYPGVLEEFIYAISSNKSIYLLGAYGGITSEIISCLINKKPLKEILMKYRSKKSADFTSSYLKYSSIDKTSDFLNRINIYSLNNGLTRDENLELFKTQDIGFASSLILKGLKSVNSKAKR